MAPAPLVGSDLYERILTAPGGLILLEQTDQAALVEQFRSLARHNGHSVYYWQPEAGLQNLREAFANIPGTQRLGATLRYIQQSAHFGIYLLSPFEWPMSAVDSGVLRQLARPPAGHVRRVILLDAPVPLAASLDDVAVRMSAATPQALRPRLRDGRWML